MDVMEKAESEKRLIDANAFLKDILTAGIGKTIIEYSESDIGYMIRNRPTVDAVEVVRCKNCVHAVDIEKDYIRKLLIDGTKQCELGRGDLCYGASIVSHDGFCDSGERKEGAD